MRILLIRHGKTAGNLKRYYVGRTDEPLCEEGRGLLTRQSIPEKIDRVYVSPMIRCRQTAEILFAGQRQIVVEDFRECDFGIFEYKSYEQLKDEPAYQDWLASGGELPFPEGESRREFQRRCTAAFQKVVQEALADGCACIACVVHGGTIMSVLDALAPDYGSYYDFQAANGCGFVAETAAKEFAFCLSVCYSIENGTYVPYSLKGKDRDG